MIRWADTLYAVRNVCPHQLGADLPGLTAAAADGRAARRHRTRACDGGPPGSSPARGTAGSSRSATDGPCGVIGCACARTRSSCALGGCSSTSGATATGTARLSRHRTSVSRTAGRRTAVRRTAGRRTHPLVPRRRRADERSRAGDDRLRRSPGLVDRSQLLPYLDAGLARVRDLRETPGSSCPTRRAVASPTRGTGSARTPTHRTGSRLRPRVHAAQPPRRRTASTRRFSPTAKARVSTPTRTPTTPTAVARAANDWMVGRVHGAR